MNDAFLYEPRVTLIASIARGNVIGTTTCSCGECRGKGTTFAYDFVKGGVDIQCRGCGGGKVRPSRDICVEERRGDNPILRFTRWRRVG